jgi:hypothetical protein
MDGIIETYNESIPKDQKQSEMRSATSNDLEIEKRMQEQSKRNK